MPKVTDTPEGFFLSNRESLTTVQLLPDFRLAQTKRVCLFCAKRPVIQMGVATGLHGPNTQRSIWTPFRKKVWEMKQAKIGDVHA